MSISYAVFCLNDAASTVIYTLSLHDALPILGLIGLGRIGSEVAVRAEAFDMRVLAYDPFISEAAAHEMSVELVPLDQLLAESDFVSLHTALRSEEHTSELQSHVNLVCRLLLE